MERDGVPQERKGPAGSSASGTKCKTASSPIASARPKSRCARTSVSASRPATPPVDLFSLPNGPRHTPWSCPRRSSGARWPDVL